MSQEAADVLRGTRIPLARLGDHAAQRRTLDERLYLRFPAIYRLFADLSTRLSPGRLRRLIIAYSVQRGYAALNRRDYDVVLIRSHPQVEYRPKGELIPPDLEDVFHGHDGYRRLWSRWFDAFADFRWEPKEILDLGDHLLVTAELTGHGSGSGVAVSESSFQLFRIERGLSVSQQDFSDRAEALEAAGSGSGVVRS
jgi:ketosteroid isomerase-like protein